MFPPFDIGKKFTNAFGKVLSSHPKSNALYDFAQIPKYNNSVL